MKDKSMRALKALSIGVLLISLDDALYAQSLPCHPLPLEVNGQVLSTKIYLCLQGATYGGPVSIALQDAPAGSAEAALKELVQSIVANNAGEFRSLSTETELPAIDREFDLYKSALEGVSDPIVVERFDIPGLVYFVLDADNSPFPIIPVLLTPVGDRFLQSMSLLTKAVCQNVSAVSQARKSNPDSFRSVLNPPTTEQIALPSPLPGPSGNPLVLRFNGSHVAFEIPSGEGSQKPPAEVDPVLRFYESVLAELRRSSKDDAEGYLSLLGTNTRAEQERFFSEIDEETFDNFRTIRTRFRQVSYVIDGGEIQILFYQGFTGDYRGVNLEYDIVYTPSEGSMKLVNVLIKDSLDHLLEWEGLARVFVDEVINRK